MDSMDLKETNSIKKNEIIILSQKAFGAFIYLSMLIILSAIVLWYLRGKDLDLLIGVTAAGIMGCSTSALLSSLQRKAHGWEKNDGTKLPVKKNENNDSKDERDMFSNRMLTFFIFRPFLGITAAYLIYFGFADIHGVDSSYSEAQANTIFWSLLAGLFAKTLFGKLKYVFEKIVQS